LGEGPSEPAKATAAQQELCPPEITQGHWDNILASFPSAFARARLSEQLNRFQPGKIKLDHIVPRWEWRTFGEDFGAAEQRFAALDPEKVQTSAEVYLLVRGSDANVKYRDNVLDIKQLERVNADGLEQWRPLLKAPFPLTAEATAQIHEALGKPAWRLKSAAASFEELLAGLELNTPDIRGVHVSKTRVRYQVRGCVAELTDVVADGKKVRTTAIEDADPARVIAAVRAMGLDGYPNINYPRGLKRVVGMLELKYAPTVRQAVIDVGTNSVKFHVGECDSDGHWTTVVDRAEVSRLGEGVQETGAIAPAAMERTAEAITGMTTEADGLAVDGITAVGTMGLRTASNSQEFLDLVKKRCGLAIEVISGDEECRIAYLAARSAAGLKSGSLVVFDTGGGSSQFTFGEGDRVKSQFSLNVGAVRYTERFGLDQAVTADVLEQAIQAIAGDLHTLHDPQRFDKTAHAASQILARLRHQPEPPDEKDAAPTSLVGMGGAVTNITAVMLGLTEYDPDKVQGAVIDRTEIDRQIELYRAIPADARRQIVGLQPKRAEVILAGACIVRTIMDKLGSSCLTVSDRGLRHGILIDRFGGRLA
jgi:exopolyphosphatase / guanosine-5'-triphosphate,3'-diphosphate pyrophosphatase